MTLRDTLPQQRAVPPRLGWWHRALGELADELEGGRGGAVVEWDPVLKIPLIG